MHLIYFVFLCWILPLVVCSLWGFAILAAADRWLGRQAANEYRSGSLPVLAAGAALVGLRILNITYLALGSMGIPFRSSTVVIVAATLFGAYHFWRSRKSLPYADPISGILRFTVWRSDLSTVNAILGGLILSVLLASLAAPPSAWDLYTHWLVVPHEMLNEDRMAFLYPSTRSVAPSYPTHQVLLGAVASFASGGRDGILNGFSAIFLLFAVFAVAEAAWLLTHSRLLSFAGGVFTLAVAGVEPVVFGFFYGDALVIACLAFSCLGFVYRLRYRNRFSPLVVWAFVSMPLMAKGIGHVLTLLGIVILLGIEVIAGFCKMGSPWRRPKVGIPILAGITLLEVFLPIFSARSVISNYHSPLKGIELSNLSITTLFGKLFETLKLSHSTLLLTLLLLILIAPLLGIIRWRRWRRSTQVWVASTLSLFGLGIASSLVIAVIYVPEIVNSLPRYTTVVGPIMVVLACASLGGLGSWAKFAGFPLVVLSASMLLASEIPSFVKRYPPTWSFAEMKRLPQRHDEFQRDRLLYKKIRMEVDQSEGRVVLVIPDNDEFLPYRIGLYFVLAKVKAKLLSTVSTCSQDERNLAFKVKEWVLIKQAISPPPYGIDLDKDFIMFPKEVIVNGRRWSGLVSVRSLTTHS